MLPGGSRKTWVIQHTFPGLDLHHTYPAQNTTTASSDLNDLDYRDLSDLSVR